VLLRRKKSISQKCSIIRNMRIIKKKCWPEYFNHILSGKKNFELRLNDFEVEEGDILILEEWDPNTKEYTGRTIEKNVTYVARFKVDEIFTSTEEELREKGLQIISLK
jgi:ASC-1-like (ASCH) protein